MGFIYSQKLFLSWMEIDMKYIPQEEPQQRFYSGQFRYHNFSSQIIMDTRETMFLPSQAFMGITTTADISNRCLELDHRYFRKHLV